MIKATIQTGTSCKVIRIKNGLNDQVDLILYWYYVQSSLTDEMKMICKDTENLRHISDGVKLELNLKGRGGYSEKHKEVYRSMF